MSRWMLDLDVLIALRALWFARLAFGVWDVTGQAALGNVNGRQCLEQDQARRLTIAVNSFCTCTS